MSMAPTSTGIGAPGTAPAPANLGRSPMNAAPGQSGPSLIPFTRASTLATMQDYSGTIGSAATQQIQLQTNAFLESLSIEFSMVTTGNTATVVFDLDGPWSVISSLTVNDPANQAIITPITGWALYTLNKYLPDTDCYFDPVRDPGFNYTTGTGGSSSNGGSFDFRLTIPIEHRRRDAFAAVNNSAANQRYLVSITTTTFTGTTAGNGTRVYSTAPTNAGTLTVTVFQQYWTAPPNAIVTSQGSVGTQQTPGGLGSVGFVRYERHNEVSGGGSPQIQFNNVGDYISTLIFTLRATSAPSTAARDGAAVQGSSNSGGANTTLPASTGNAVAGGAVQGNGDWPTLTGIWVNDFQVHNLNAYMWQRWMARHYGYFGGVSSATSIGGTGNPGCLDVGVFVLHFLNGIFDRIENYAPANQYLPTDATTKLQIRGSSFGAGSTYLELHSRTLRPVSGAALFGSQG